MFEIEWRLTDGATRMINEVKFFLNFCRVHNSTNHLISTCGGWKEYTMTASIVACIEANYWQAGNMEYMHE